MVKINKKFLLAVAWSGWTASVGWALPSEYFVSPDGSDQAAGTREAPFRTLNQAKVAAAESAARNPEVSVFLRGGSYVLDETLVFTSEESPPPGHSIFFKAYADEEPVIHSLKTVSGWYPVESYLGGLTEAARGKVWVADLAAKPNFKTLYHRGTMLPRARSDGFLPVRSEPGAARLNRLRVPDKEILRRWQNPGDVELLIRPKYPWAMNILPLASVDPEAGVVTTARNGTYPLEPQPEAFQAVHELKETAWLENAIDFLDAPGEWVLDTARGRLYLWPPDGERPSAISYPQLVELVRLDGGADGPGFVAAGVRGIHFEGITFTGNDRYTWREDEPSLQHDWSAVDQPNAMLRFRSAEDSSVVDCRFAHGGSAGVRVDLRARNIRIEGNRFTELGEHGVVLCGYGPGTKDVNQGNFVLNNRIDHIGRLHWYASGIYIAQSGQNVVSNNLIHNLPYIGITLSGARDFRWQNPGQGEGYRSIRWQDISEHNRVMLREAYGRQEERTDFFLSLLHARDNRIERNEIFNVVEWMGDGNAIYLSGAGKRNVVRENFVHHVLSDGITTGIRPDDLQEETLFERNIVYKCVYGAIEHKHQNHYINNIFAEIYPVNPFGNRWDAWAYFIFGRGPVAGTRVQNNIFYAERFAPRFYHARWNAPMDEALIDRNLYWYVGDPETAREQVRAQRGNGHDAHSAVENPQFNDLSKYNFSLASGSPALRLGFRPIDVGKIGLQTPWKNKLLGSELIRTRIRPETRAFEPGETIRATIQSDQPDAVIRYTLDGSEPTSDSQIYTEPLLLKNPSYIRTKAFSEEAEDLYGDAAFYPRP